MAQRSLNKVHLIGNLTRDPELRYTPQGTAVCTLGLATNRTWVTEAGEKKESTEFHRLVAWNKLAELCSQLLFKGRRIYVEGRLQTRQWTAQDGKPRQTTEIVIDEMMILDSRRAPGEEMIEEETGGEGVMAEETVVGEAVEPQPIKAAEAPVTDQAKPTTAKKSTDDTDDKKKDKKEEVNAEDIPF